ncbi:hypothetical protein [Paracoccus pacificus]|uniref:Uncharacterized protein n=1 Tax=Paracoccus pacificus TaxID=1463598 RepID=A0ABW4R3V5_9RHOB
MSVIVLHGSRMVNRQAAHEELVNAFGLTDGAHLTLLTLAEALRALPSGTRVIWQGYGAAVDMLGDYADRIEAVLTKADNLDLETD